MSTHVFFTILNQNTNLDFTDRELVMLSIIADCQYFAVRSLLPATAKISHFRKLTSDYFLKFKKINM